MLALPAITVLLSLGVPFLTLGGWLVAGGSAVWQMGEILSALWQTMLLALAGGAADHCSRLADGLAVGPRAGPPAAAARGLQLYRRLAARRGGGAGAGLRSRCGSLLPLYQTLVTILAAYALMFLPRAMVGLRAEHRPGAGGARAGRGQSRRTPARALWATTIRLAAPGAAAGMALASLGIMNELTATQMLAPNGTRTLAMAFWSLSGELDYAAAAPYAVVMIVISLPLTWLLFLQSKRLAGQ